MICNKDCFNCPYDDCINDNLTTEDYKSDEVEQFTSDNPSERVIKQRKLSRDRMRQIRVVNPNYNKDYYMTHREQELKRNADAKKNNRDYYNAYQRERYTNNREEMCRKRREYRARKKAERVS
jgi:hypothetical protein